MLNVACIIAGSYKIAARTKLGRFLGRCQRYTMASVKAQPCVNIDKCHGTGQDDASRDWCRDVNLYGCQGTGRCQTVTFLTAQKDVNSDFCDITGRCQPSHLSQHRETSTVTILTALRDVNLDTNSDTRRSHKRDTLLV
jgi:hypothetical protein